MILSKKNLSLISGKEVEVPDNRYFGLPEKVLQFGTGVLLRGLPDFFIDKANKQGLFNGRVVVVKSTRGETNLFDQQDCLYTLCIRGIEEGQRVDRFLINASVSRVLSAREEWEAILACAANPEMEVVISNTTEVGITLTEDDVTASPPASFPGKLLAFLLTRYKAFEGDPEKGMVIVPTELIPDNGDKLRAILIELARMNRLDQLFIDWLQGANHFCNSLVDRIVPGSLPGPEQKTAEDRLGYQDSLMIMAEPYRLWAIEAANGKVREVLTFSQADEGVVIVPDIDIFRELKLRLLNGTHTFSCGLACLAGFKTVKEAMDDPVFARFVTVLMQGEIAPAITGKGLTAEEARRFSEMVLDRFHNPFIEHQWLSITMQYSSKMRMRNVPILLKHYEKSRSVPAGMALGMASYILFMRVEKGAEGKYGGRYQDQAYTVQDDQAAALAAKWQTGNTDVVVENVLQDTELWGTDLAALPGFTDAVRALVRSLLSKGVIATIQTMQANKAQVNI